MITPELIHRRNENLKKKCREKSFRLTPQKLEVFSVLASSHSHPTAEEIFLQIREKFPTISLATVYRNLRHFVEIGVAKELDFGDGSSHFDANTDEHDHIINTDTKEIIDFCIPEKQKFIPKISDDMVLEGVSVNIFIRKKI